MVIGLLTAISISGQTALPMLDEIAPLKTILAQRSDAIDAEIAKGNTVLVDDSGLVSTCQVNKSLCSTAGRLRTSAGIIIAMKADWPSPIRLSRHISNAMAASASCLTWYG